MWATILQNSRNDGIKQRMLIGKRPSGKTCTRLSLYKSKRVNCPELAEQVLYLKKKKEARLCRIGSTKK